MTTMRDVAVHAGVSAKTVSRVFRDDPLVAPDTRARVKRAMRELDYRPNMLARTFREGRDQTIGVAVPDLGDPFFATIVRVIEERALARGMACIVTSVGQAVREQRGVESLLHRQVSGLILAPVSHDQGYLVTWQARTPTVFIDRAPSGIVADCVTADDEADACTATEHLLAFGHSRIAFIGDTTALTTTALRRRGYLRALAQAGISADPSLIRLDETLLTYGYPSVEHAVEAIAPLLASVDPPTAIFSSNAQCSMGVAAALQRLGRADVALVSFGDFPMAGMLSPAVTVIDQDPAGLATAACESLFRRLDGAGDEAFTRRIIPLRVIERGSGELPAPSPTPQAGRKKKPRE